LHGPLAAAEVAVDSPSAGSSLPAGLVHAENSSAPLAATATAALSRLIFNVPPQGDAGIGLPGGAPQRAPGGETSVTVMVSAHATHAMGGFALLRRLLDLIVTDLISPRSATVATHP
jgi:hypothetical protein